MEATRAARLGSYVLATSVLLVAGPVVGLLGVVPDAVAQRLAEAGSVDEGLLFVGVPLGLAVLVLARATTGTPTDVVLAAFAVPSLLTSVWAIYSATATDAGVYWGGFLSITAGTFLALAVVADAVLGRLAK